MSTTPMINVASEFGGIDIYLFDQIQRGRIRPGMTILDVGCGSGRNLVYFMRAGFDVYAVDEDARAVEAVRDLAARLAPSLPPDRFRTGRLDSLPIPESSVDVVICSAVLHFARDPDHFWSMLAGSWRPLRPGGLYFCRLASTVALEGRCGSLGGGRYVLPSGEHRYLVDEVSLAAAAARLRGTLLDPLKTTVVHGQRSMTTWVLTKDA